MRELCLLAVLAAAILLGLFIMKRLDRFLARNEMLPDKQPVTQNNLRLGFENPMLAACITGVLTQFEKKYPDTAILIYSGTEEQLLQELSGHRVDVVFVHAENVSALPFSSKQISLQHKPLHLAYHGFTIEPVDRSAILQTVLWSKAAEAGAMGYFLKCLQSCAKVQ